MIKDDIFVQKVDLIKMTKHVGYFKIISIYLFKFKFVYIHFDLVILTQYCICYNLLSFL